VLSCKSSLFDQGVNGDATAREPAIADGDQVGTPRRLQPIASVAVVVEIGRWWEAVEVKATVEIGCGTCRRFPEASTRIF